MENIPEGAKPSMERVSSKTSIIGRPPQWIKRVVNSVASRRPVSRLKHGKLAEEEASSSSWIQMVKEVNMLGEATKMMKKAPPRSWSSFSVELLKRLKSTSPYAQKAHHITEKQGWDCDLNGGSMGTHMGHNAHPYREGIHQGRGREGSSSQLDGGDGEDPGAHQPMPGDGTVEDALHLPGAGMAAYRPQVVSLGTPFHHDDPKLRLMEEHKCRLMLHMVKRSKKPLAEFVKAVEAIADKLQHAYDERIEIASCR
ncbi:hypothetical protein ACP70R_008235 [Stipagrostis hirtigluma subsp. patula]